MSWLITLLRRLLVLALLGAIGGAIVTWWRERTAPPAPAQPEWPPLGSRAPGSAPSAPSVEPMAKAPSSTGSSSTGSSSEESSSGSSPEESSSSESSSGSSPATDVATRPADDSSSSSVVNALVDAPDARPNGSDGGTWVEPNDDGSCPISHPIKANDNSGIFHVPEGTFYERTKAERCYTTAEAAIADGYRRAKS